MTQEELDLIADAVADRVFAKLIQRFAIFAAGNLSSVPEKKPCEKPKPPVIRESVRAEMRQLMRKKGLL